MMNFKLSLSLICLMLVPTLVFSQGGPELLVTKNKSIYTIDFANEKSEPITAMMFSINIGELSEQQIDLAKCVSGLPETHVGFCKYNPGVVKVVIYSNSNALLPQIGNIGSVKIESRGRVALLTQAGRNSSHSVKFADVVFSKTDGVDIEGVILQ